MTHQRLQQHILAHLPPGSPIVGLEQVLAAFQPYQIKKNEVLLEVQEVCQHCYFIVEGCIKTSTYTDTGEERTIDLAFEEDWRSSLPSFLQQQPSQERLVAVETCQLLVIHYNAFQQLCAAITPFEQLYRQLLEGAYAKSVARVHSFMTLDALDRLNWLLERHPMIFTRLSNRLIASYLNISEATLSRLKSKL